MAPTKRGDARGAARGRARAHDERAGSRGPGPRQCLEQHRLSTENVKPLRASVTEGDKEKGGTKITLDSAALSGSKIPALRGNDRRRGGGQFDARPARARARGVQCRSRAAQTGLPYGA